MTREQIEKMTGRAFVTQWESESDAGEGPLFEQFDLYDTEVDAEEGTLSVYYVERKTGTLITVCFEIGEGAVNWPE